MALHFDLVTAINNVIHDVHQWDFVDHVYAILPVSLFTASCLAWQLAKSHLPKWYAYPRMTEHPHS